MKKLDDMRIFLSAAATLLLFSFAARAADPSGYVDFGDLETLTGNPPRVEVDLGGPMIRFLAAASREAEPDVADMMSKLKSVRVNVFDLAPGSEEATHLKLQSLAADLEARDWERAVVVREEGETIVHMYMKLDGEDVVGLTFMAVDDDDEAIFINIVGEVDPEQLGKLAAKFGVDGDWGNMSHFGD